MRLDPHRTSIATLLLWRRRSVLVCKLFNPDAIAAVLMRRAAGALKIGIETGPMTVWLWHALTALELRIVCLDARHAAAALKLQMNKTDRNDAFGLARLVRSGWYRPVAVRFMKTHRLHALLITRDQLVGMTD